ncbi:hypothetical protein DP117_14060 [Brasilonema sp. UFV-L1]|nr:hypothetical protein [Brasilonema sp. UFV-L1]
MLERFSFREFNSNKPGFLPKCVTNSLVNYQLSVISLKKYSVLLNPEFRIEESINSFILTGGSAVKQRSW